MSFLTLVTSCFSTIFVYISIFFIPILRQSRLLFLNSSFVNPNNNLPSTEFTAFTVIIATLVSLDARVLLLSNLSLSFNSLLFLFQPLIIFLGSLTYLFLSPLSMNHIIINICLKNLLTSFHFTIIFSILITLFSSHFLSTYLFSTCVNT